MAEIDPFSEGPLFPLLAVGMCFVGCLLGVLSLKRARRGPTVLARVRWVVLGALALGGTGAWATHFVAMLGFAVAGTPIRYDGPLMLLSVGVAVVASGLGLALLAGGGRTLLGVRATLAGTVVGLGVAGTHYGSMAALHLHAVLTVDRAMLGAAVVVAVSGSVIALWTSVAQQGRMFVTIAALCQAAAVCGMHYLLIAGTSAELTEATGPLPGGVSSDLGEPLLLGLSVVTVVALILVVTAPDAREEQEERRVLARLAERSGGDPWTEALGPGTGSSRPSSHGGRAAAEDDR
ncbi:MHYT domain-containing protein [Actinoalloteichus spitiensis]|uniref:MHYT domain-containing protein n=1 Tax=Actinoalloteichus spitiensis TaxID=252394 RepID=UPI000382DA6A|nr:MHYT domain-containing protein [Actinoalloteichus spitiensis]